MWLLLYLFFAPFSPKIDLYVSGLFYSPENGFYNNSFFQFLFAYGEACGFAIVGIAVCACIFSYFLPPLKKWRRGSFLIIFTFFIGAGLITNICFKDHWGRPRPKQVEQFGGKHAYRPVWKPNFHTKNDPQKSFPSGHAAMGFYYLSLVLVGRRYQSKPFFYFGLFLTLFWGIGLMVARVVQGGHFVSDVLASPVIMWYTARAADKIVFIRNPKKNHIVDSLK